MTKANYAPPASRSIGSIDPSGLPQTADHAPFKAASEDERQDNAPSDNDNGGNSAGNQGNGSGG